MTPPLRVLMVAEGSGGHLIPALQVAAALSKAGASTTVWYAARPQMAGLSKTLAEAFTSPLVEIAPIPAPARGNPFLQAWGCGRLVARSRRRFRAVTPDVVVGFGGLISAPVVLAARLSRIRTLLHEQNVVMGRANRLLSRCVDRIAVSFEATRQGLNGTPSVVTGMPVRAAIGQVARSDAAARLGLEAGRPTLLVLGGSQGSRAINRLVTDAIARCAPEERARWQVLHLAGSADTSRVEAGYRRAGLTAVVMPSLADMASAYAAADLVIGRAGASTIAELAQAGVPSLLIPYPHAGGHQRANARLVEEVGGGIVLEESSATPEELLATVRRIMGDASARETMGRQVRRLAAPDATARLAQMIVELGGVG